ncbi:hypothetical protein C0991_002073 [Blastosporella zonata]|nr:hypothetical protein C0991_002073 [Blastosporella zonata]
MGFLKRIFSIGSKKNKKQRPQIVHNVDSQLRAIEEEEHEAAIGRLLRSSSTRYTVVSEVEYSSLPPLPHPINDVLQAPGAQVLQTPRASTASIASSTISQRGTYNVTVHKRQRHNTAELQSASSNRPVDVERAADELQPKELSSHLLELRSHPSVASLLDMYDEQGRIPDQAFSNSPPSPERKERAQTRRNGSTLRQLLGEPASVNSRNGNGAGSAEGDISWAERFLREADSVSSVASSVDLRTPSIHNTHFHNQNNDISFATDYDLSTNTYENPAISSMEVELSLADSIPSAETRSAASPYKSPDPSTPQRASQVFQFLTERRRSAYNTDQERSLPDLPSTFSVSSDGDSLNRSNGGRSHFSDDSFDALAQPYPAIPNAPPSDTSISQPDYDIPLSKFSPVINALSSRITIDAPSTNATPVNATETVWVAPNARRRDIVNAPTKVIITAPTPSGKSETPSRIPRGPRAQYRKTSGSSNKVRRTATLADRATNYAVTRTQRDPFTPLPSKNRHRRTPSGGSSSSSRSRHIEIGRPTRLSRRGSSTRSMHSELDKENGGELTVKSTLPSTPMRSKSDSKPLFRGAITPSMFHPPPTADLSSDLSPVGKQLMMNVRQQRSKARNFERQRSGASGASELAIYHHNAPNQAQTSYATYLVCGEIDPPYMDEMNMDYEQGKDLDGDYEDDGDEVPETKLLLANESDLEGPITFAVAQDAGHICTPTEHIRAADRGKDAKELIKIVGKVVSSNIKVVHSAPKVGKSTRQPVAGPSRLKEKEASVEVAKEESKTTADTPKEKEKHKATGKLDFSKAKPKEKNADASAEAAKVKKEKGAAEKVKEAKEKAKEKEKEKKKEKEKEEEQEKMQEERKKKTLEPAKVCPPVAHASNVNDPAPQRGTKRKSALDVSDSEDERPSKVPSRRPSPLPPAKETMESVRVKGRALISDDEDEEPVQGARKARQGRVAAAVDPDNEDVLAMMDIDDDNNMPSPQDQVMRVSRDGRAQSKEEEEEEEEEEKDAETLGEKPAAVDEDVDMADEFVPKAKPKKRAPKKVIPVGSNGLKKRRVVKSRSKVDDKGYMVFEDYSEYESADENEAEAEVEAEKARGKAKAKASTKAKAKVEQQDESGDEPAKVKAAVKAKDKAPLKAKAKGGQKQGVPPLSLSPTRARLNKNRESQATRANLAWLPHSLSSFSFSSSFPFSNNSYHELAHSDLIPSRDTHTNTEHEYEMVQTYGVARANDADPSGSGAGEGSALLGTWQKIEKKDGHASVVSCISNLTNTIMGTGASTASLSRLAGKGSLR